MMSRFCFKVMQKHCCNAVESYNVIFIMLLYVRSIGSLNKATMREKEREREREREKERKREREKERDREISRERERKQSGTQPICLSVSLSQY